MSASLPSQHNNNLTKIGAVLAIISLAHVGAFWLLKNMEFSPLKPLEKTKPIEVKFVTLKPEPPPPPPPPPKPKPEPKKPEPKKPEPKPEPKKPEPKKPEPKPEPPKPKVEKPKPKPEPKKQPPPPAPKVIATPKPTVQKPDTPKVTQREVIKDPKPSSVQDPNQTVKTPPKVAEPKPEPAPPVKKVETPPATPPAPPSPPVKKVETPPTPPASKVDMTPRNVSAAQVSWRSRPNVVVTDKQKEKMTNSVVKVKITANEKGRFTEVTIVGSSGSPEVDKKVIADVRRGSIKPYIENGVAVPIAMYLSLNLKD